MPSLSVDSSLWQQSTQTPTVLPLHLQNMLYMFLHCYYFLGYLHFLIIESSLKVFFNQHIAHTDKNTALYSITLLHVISKAFLIF